MGKKLDLIYSAKKDYINVKIVEDYEVIYKCTKTWCIGHDT